MSLLRHCIESTGVVFRRASLGDETPDKGMISVVKVAGSSHPKSDSVRAVTESSHVLGPAVKDSVVTSKLSDVADVGDRAKSQSKVSSWIDKVKGIWRPSQQWGASVV